MEMKPYGFTLMGVESKNFSGEECRGSREMNLLLQ